MGKKSRRANRIKRKENMTKKERDEDVLKRYNEARDRLVNDRPTINMIKDWEKMRYYTFRFKPRR